MKNLLIMLFLQCLILCNSVLHAQWVQTNGPNGGSVLSLAVSGNNIFAGTADSGIYLSTNNGTSWTLVDSGLSNLVYALTVIGTNIFAGTADNNKPRSGVFLSTNDGTTWTHLNNGLTYPLNVYAIVESGNNIIAGSVYDVGGMFLSTNNGTNWTRLSIGLPTNHPDLSVYSLAVNGSNVFAGTEGGVFRSTNNGTDWTQVNNGITSNGVFSVAVSGTNIFAGADEYYQGGGLFHSTDKGTNWTQLTNGLPSPIGINTLAVNGSNIFAGTSEDGVFLSTNNGTSWTQVNNGLTDTNISSFTFIGNNIYAGTEGGSVWRRPLSELTGVSNEKKIVPQEYTLFQNYPNPFNPSTVIKYSIPFESNVNIRFYNSLGQIVREVNEGNRQPGSYEINFNSSGLASGIYFYSIKAVSANGKNDFSSVKKMILLK